MRPILLQFGSLKINSWGTMVIIALVAAILVTIIRARTYKIPPKRVRAALHLVIFVIIAGFVGARLFSILEHPQILREYPDVFSAIRHGGLSWYGGFLFAFIVGLLLLRKSNLRIGAALDILAPGIALGFFFGRMGCFLKGCCFGKPTLIPWGVVFPPESYASMVYGEQVSLHPTQLYSSFAGLISFFILLFIEKKIKKKLHGLIFFSFLILYGTWRFIIELFRWHDPELILFGWFTRGQAFSIASIILGITLILWTIKCSQRD
ncbi:prolipoprotein diacylglyceryl transferase [candidate division WOR-3 bacterium]|nr:prolipoprotein diacylglyceryl transferase [candidate division WOR-3 bacterium]